jgi:hypothetical protein
VGGELTLDPGSLITGGARQVLLQVGEFVRVKTQLCLGDVEVGVVIGGVGCVFGSRRRSTGGGGKLLDQGLVLIYELLELIDLLGESKGFAGEGAMLRLHGGDAEGGGEGLIDFVIGEALGFVRVFGLFGGDGQGRESLRGLPRAEIDDGSFYSVESRTGIGMRDEGKMRHGIAGSPRKHEAENKQDHERRKQRVTSAAEKDGTGFLFRTGNDRRKCHTPFSQVDAGGPMKTSPAGVWMQGDARH